MCRCRPTCVAELLAFLGVSALVIVTPGQDTALTIRNTLLGGRAAGVCTAIGVSAGQATWTVCTAFGVGALLVASGSAFLALKLAGAAYLIYLGVTAYALVVTRAGALLRRERVRRAIERVTGTVLIALGVRLATQQH